MLSFIVIGKNEGWKLTKCMLSIFDTITSNNLNSYEIIYVDSCSSDDSIQRVRAFPGVKILKLTNDCNSAIARNLGASESNGEILLFIDGDMELMPDFFPVVFDAKFDLRFDYVSGQFLENYYNDPGKPLIPYHKFKNSQISQVTTGGLFIIRREYWTMINGMREKYKRSQDLDFGLRLAEKGIKLIRKQDVMAVHNTINKRDGQSIWKFLLSGADLYGRSMLYRDHVFNHHIYGIIIRQDYSFLILLLSCIISVIFSFPSVLYIYLITIAGRSVLSSKGTVNSIKRVLYFFLRDILVFIGLFVFYPRTKFEIKYTKLLSQ